MYDAVVFGVDTWHVWLAWYASHFQKCMLLINAKGLPEAGSSPIFAIPGRNEYYVNENPDAIFTHLINACIHRGVQLKNTPVRCVENTNANIIINHTLSSKYILSQPDDIFFHAPRKCIISIYIEGDIHDPLFTQPDGRHQSMSPIFTYNDMCFYGYKPNANRSVHKVSIVVEGGTNLRTVLQNAEAFYDIPLQTVPWLLRNQLCSPQQLAEGWPEQLAHTVEALVQTTNKYNVYFFDAECV